jgi:hypothetical protein
MMSPKKGHLTTLSIVLCLAGLYLSLPNPTCTCDTKSASMPGPTPSLLADYPAQPRSALQRVHPAASPARLVDKLMIVAHSDDETIFGAHALLSSPGWMVVCATCQASSRFNIFRAERPRPAAPPSQLCTSPL